MPTVSVALCTHNGAAHIQEQVRSILAQSFGVVEIVLSDDASTDNTVELAAAAVAGSPVELRVLRNATPLGVTRNFEQAILACTGELVALSDQDDSWHHDRIERGVSVFADNPRLSLVHSDAVLVDASGVPLGATLFEALGIDRDAVRTIHDGGAFELLARRNLVTGATAMLRRSLAVDCAPFPTGWVHDEWLAIVAAARGELDVIAEPLVDYRQHGSNEIGAQKLSVVAKFSRMVEPGAARSERLLARATSLVDRLPALAPDRASAVAEKLEHERVRSSLGRSRFTRISPVLRELRTGRYSAFGRGAADAVRDLLQPL